MEPQIDYLEARYTLFALLAAALTYSRRFVEVPPADILRDLGLILVFLFTGERALLRKLAKPYYTEYSDDV